MQLISLIIVPIGLSKIVISFDNAIIYVTQSVNNLKCS